MALSKKHCIDLARMVDNMPNTVTKDELVSALISFCAEHGPNFDKQRFIAACFGNW